MRRLYPQYVEDAQPVPVPLRRSSLAEGDKPAALAVLADYRKYGGEDPATLKKLASLQEESGSASEEAAATLDAHQRHLSGERRGSSPPPRRPVAQAAQLPRRHPRICGGRRRAPARQGRGAVQPRPGLLRRGPDSTRPSRTFWRRSKRRRATVPLRNYSCRSRMRLHGRLDEPNLIDRTTDGYTGC